MSSTAGLKSLKLDFSPKEPSGTTPREYISTTPREYISTTPREVENDLQQHLLGMGGVPKMRIVFWHLLPIGVISFGGTQANLAMFYNLLVHQLRWVPQAEFAELLSLVQSLPGDSACQILLTSVTVATGSVAAGFLAFLLFSIPSAIVMGLLGSCLGSTALHQIIDQVGWSNVTDLQISVDCVATACLMVGAWHLSNHLVRDPTTKVVWLGSCLLCFCSAGYPSIASWVSVFCLAIGGLVALIFNEEGPLIQATMLGEIPKTGLSKAQGRALFITTWALVVVFCALAHFYSGEENEKMGQMMTQISLFYRAGCLIFGGGSVVAPILLFDLAETGMIHRNQFILGFSFAQLLPGPMFNLAAFCGGLLDGWQGAVVCWTAMNMPGIWMAAGALPFWAELRLKKGIRHALKGVNAAAAGLMGAAVLILWKHVVIVKNDRVCLTLIFAGAQQIFNLKAYWLLVVWSILVIAKMSLLQVHL